LSDIICLTVKTTLRNFQRQFAAIRAHADAGERVEIKAADGKTYVFGLSEPPRIQSMAEIFSKATSELEITRDKGGMRNS
jgi:hypothetical protein